jgi:2-polyprenyl-3-methyl-5-hydroxy-6-metoxy-1,4-benzoquinol methylase
MKSGCRICGAPAERSFSANGFNWLNCNGCGSVQKVLTKAQYLDLHPSYDPGAYLDSASRTQIERFLRVDDATRVLERAVPRTFTGRAPDGSTRSFLDVGCGMGAYLLAAQKLGFEVMGFEPSVDHAHVATAHLKLPVVSDYFSPERVDGRSFDLIMLSHVIEHIYSPKEFLHALVGVLKPGGILMVITPNSDSIVARVTGRLWPMLKPVDHVSMICAKTYSAFELEDLADVSHSYSEFPYEFAATVAAVLKAKMGQPAAATAATRCVAPPPLRRLDFPAQILKGVLTAASSPAWILAVLAGKRACLNSVIVRKGFA